MLHYGLGSTIYELRDSKWGNEPKSVWLRPREICCNIQTLGWEFETKCHVERDTDERNIYIISAAIGTISVLTVGIE